MAKTCNKIGLFLMGSLNGPLGNCITVCLIVLPRTSGFCWNHVYWSWSLRCILFQIHINIITYLRWLLDLRCEWYDETFKWTSGTHGTMLLLLARSAPKKSKFLAKVGQRICDQGDQYKLFGIFENS